MSKSRSKYNFVITRLPGPVIQDRMNAQEIYFQYDVERWSGLRPLLRSAEDRAVTYLYMCMRFPEEMESAPWRNV